MSVSLGNGTLIMKDIEQNSVLQLDSLSCVSEVEMSAEEIPPISLCTNTRASFEMDMNKFNVTNNIINPYEKFSIEYNMPIKIQSRWHKKKRIRKKWLKRYGVKPDVVLFKGKADIEYAPGNMDFDYYNFNFNITEYEYILRQDQMRRGIKIEW